MTVKAIDTIYKGYKFRSRLEARWAVYMDLCDIKWEYEPEGYELPSGRYLPDFYVPAYKSYLEVKPASFEIDPKSREIRLLEELAEGSLRGAVLVAGDPHEFKCREASPRPFVDFEGRLRSNFRAETSEYSQFEMTTTISWAFRKVVGREDMAAFDEAFSSMAHYHEAARDFLASHGFEPLPDGSMHKTRMIGEDRFEPVYTSEWGDYTDKVLVECGFLHRELWVPFDMLGDARTAAETMISACGARPWSLLRELKKHRETSGLKARQARFEHGQSGAE